MYLKIYQEKIFLNLILFPVLNFFLHYINSISLNHFSKVLSKIILLL